MNPFPDKNNSDPRIYKENLAFLKTLQNDQHGITIQKLRDIHDEVFDATDCLQCANCCKTTPALVTKADIQRIAPTLQMSAKQFIRNYVLEDINGEMNLNRIPCHFLNADHSCAIYEVRPEACRRYPHTDEKGFFNRPALNARNTVICPAAFQIVEKLKSITQNV